MKCYVVDIRLARCEFLLWGVIATDSDYALIGRDILNGYKITLDGINETWEVDAKCDSPDTAAD